MNEYSFDGWFNDFWNKYSKKYTDNCSPKKGPKTKAKLAAQNAFKRSLKAKEVTTEEEFSNMCDLALDAQKKYWDEAARNNKWMPNFPMVVTWFNQERWSLELDSHSELKDIAVPSQKEGKKPIPGKITDINKANEYRAKAKQMLGIK